MPAVLLTTAEVAAIARRHPRTIGIYVRKGLLRGTLVGNALRFDPAEVERFLAGQARQDDLEDVVARLVAEAPTLTEAQRSRLASLLAQSAGDR